MSAEMERTLSPQTVRTRASMTFTSEKQAQVDDDNRACDPQVKMDIILSSLSKGSSSEACLLTAPREACVNQNRTQSAFNKELPR